MRELARVQGHIVVFLALESKWPLVILRCNSLNFLKGHTFLLFKAFLKLVFIVFSIRI